MKTGRLKECQGNHFKGNKRLSQSGSFKIKCLKRGQVEYYMRDSLENNSVDEDGAVFALGEERRAGWPIDSEATSHMTPQRRYLLLRVLEGGRQKAASVRKRDGQIRREGLRIKCDALHIPGLDRRLLSAGELAARGMKVEVS